MADQIAGQIWIGGQVSRRLKVAKGSCFTVLEGLIGEINSANVSHAWGDANADIEDDAGLLKYLIEDGLGDGWLYFCDDEARNGEFEELEAYCRKNGIPFRRVSDSCAEYDAEEMLFIPPGWNTSSGCDLTWIVSASCNPVVDGEKVREALELFKTAIQRTGGPILNHGSIPFQSAMGILRELCPEIPDLPKFEIVD